MNLCACGCGAEVKPGKRFVLYHHLNGSSNPRYKGGLYLSNEKQRWVIICRDGSREYYARAVMEAKLKRKLLPGEVVHHINSNTLDDSPENLELMYVFDHNILSSTKYTAEDLLNYLRIFYNKNGRSPKNNELRSHPEYPHTSSYLRVFGTWNNALKMAGLPLNKEMLRRKKVS